MQDEMLFKDKNTLREKYLTLLICVVIGFSPISNMFLISLRRIIILPYKLDTIFVYGLLLFVVFYASELIMNRIQLQDISLMLVFVTFWSLSLLTTDNYDYFRTIGIQFITGAVPCYVVCRSVRNYELTRKYLGIVAILVTVSEFLLLFVLNTGLSEKYSQYAAYQLLPAAIISVSELLRKKTPIHIINFLAAVFLIFATGARGPLFCIALFLGVKAIIAMKKSIRNIMLITISTLLVLLAIKYFLYDILNYMRVIMVQNNLSVRVIDRMLSNQLLKDNVRISIANYAWQAIMEHPILGVGLGKDRIIIAALMLEPASEVIGLYPHNIILELYMQFGVFLGNIILISIIVLFLRAIFRTEDKEAQDLVCIFVAIGVFPLFFSGSYLTSGLFFCAVAISQNVCQSIKYNRFHKIVIRKESTI